MPLIECCSSQRRSFLLTAVMVLTSAAGCGDSNRATVSGQVTLDGKPIALGSITFIPVERGPGKVTGGSIQEGQFRLDDEAAPAVGNYRVEIRATRKSGRMVRPAFAGPEEMVEGTEEAIAAKYNDQSTLEFEVKAGNNEVSWDVESRK